MELFWRQGFEATSLTDLTNAMGINPPSLYSAFGDKERLFLEAVKHYWTYLGCRDPVLDSAPTARAAIESLLQACAKFLTAHGSGCMVVTSAMNCSINRVQDALRVYRTEMETSVRKRIERGMTEGDLSPGTDAGALAKFYETVMQGMSSQAADGATRKNLLNVAAHAMRAWPMDEKPSPHK